MTVDEFRDLLSARQCKPTGNGQLSARCPAHEDGTASLSVTAGTDGRLLVHCHAGCSLNNITAALGITIKDLFPVKAKRTGSIIAVYDYVDEAGTLLFQVLRTDTKEFPQRKASGEWGTKGVRKVLYRLPQVIAGVKDGKPIIVCEGEKDVEALEANGFIATCNPGGASKSTGRSKWLPCYNGDLTGADVTIVPDKDETGRIHAQQVAAALNGIASSVRVIELPDLNGRTVKDAHDYFSAGGTADQFRSMVHAAPVWTPSPSSPITAPLPSKPAADDLQRAIADARPKIRLPGNDRLVSDYSSELAAHLRDQDVFVRNGEVVILEEEELRTLNAQSFRTWIETYVIGYRSKTIGENSFEFDVTMRDDEARGVMASPQFISGLRKVSRVAHARLPFLNAAGGIELLPAGYHEATRTLTLNSEDFERDMQLGEATNVINDLLSEFVFADSGQSRSVVIGAMLGLFANGLLPEKSLRPCFQFIANAEGAGKTLLAMIVITPTLGTVPIGTNPDDDDEMRKVLLTAVREARPVVFLDNLKGHLSSAPLEGFLSAPEWTGRRLGASESVTAPNMATVFITGNGLTISPDLRRRSLFVELIMAEERAEDRTFKRTLDMPTLLSMRPKVLAALWSMVRHWDSKGRPGPARGHSAFSSWASVIGGIVECAGFGCPLETARLATVADSDGDDMRSLVTAMADGTRSSWTFSELVDLARSNGLFTTIIGAEASEMDRKGKTIMGRLLSRYDRRMVKNQRFLVEGKGHGRRYRVIPLHDAHDQHDVSVRTGNSLHAGTEGEHHADHADHVADLPGTADLMSGWPTKKL